MLSEILTYEQISFLGDLTHRMKTQDNRGTAQPYALVIGQKKRQITDWDMASEYQIYWDECTYDSFEEFYEAIRKYYLEDEEQNEIINYIDENCDDFDSLRYHQNTLSEKMGLCLSVTGYIEVEDFSHEHCGGNFFLTDVAAKQYVEKNKHNLINPFTYGIHLYRNHEMEKLYEILGVLGQHIKAKEDSVCEWNYIAPNLAYRTQCENIAKVTSIQHEGIEFCPYCGRKVEEASHEN